MKKFFKFALPIFLILVVSAGILLVLSLRTETRADIVTTLYPEYDIARHIAKDKLTVANITPFGSEVHDYGPTAQDIIAIQQAKLFIYTSNEFERWVPNILSDTKNPLNLYEEINNSSLDSHYWTDPVVLLDAVNIIRNRIIEIDPENETYYTQNAQEYYNKIVEVHNDLLEFFNSKENPQVFFYGHNALKAFSTQYGLSIVSLSNSFKPDAELTPSQIVELKNKIKQANAKYLFVEELIDLKGPNSLKTELSSEGYDLTILELHSLHNISNKQHKEGVSLVDLLKQNFENLKTAIS